ncbi:MAG: hypothetical protein Q4G14_13510 [Paracoccus sp. (in: a-proteobacteria)]|uniref:hypothetical protein n=1 Tax=Paracoccus sp. TaxID=267 RepID=UPI0026DF7C8C|nr:hypothetical protein [Paracoccus sp. (in: a-proteobacteria)]MDO5614242.1 hypothetical protein [Paracoccus sp. (in: a-proteobacteria)]
MKIAAALALIAAPLAALADPVHLPAGDGVQAVVTPMTTAGGNRVFVVEEIIPDSAPDGDVVAMFWLWPNMTEWPEIEPTGPGQFTARAGCDTCGRTGWRLDYKAARRGDGWVLAGWTQTRNDRTSAQVTVCDVNLLTGRVVISHSAVEDAAEQITTAATAARAIPLSLVTADYMVPECAAPP